MFNVIAPAPASVRFLLRPVVVAQRCYNIYSEKKISTRLRPLAGSPPAPSPGQLRMLWGLLCYIMSLFGRSGLAVACLTAVREVLGSSRAVGSCVYRKSHCDLQPWARAVCTFPAVPGSSQPSTLRGTVNEYQLSG